VLPPVIHAVVGREANLYFDNVVLVLDRADYAFDAICEKGNQLDERWTFTPTPKDVGDFPLEVMVRDESNDVIARGSTVVRVVPKAGGTTKVTTLLLVGASLTEYSVYPQELLDLDSRDEHLQLKLIGSRGKGDGPPEGALRHEGYSGWTAQAFVVFAGPLSRSGIYKRPDTGSPFVYEDEPGKKHLDFGRYCKEFNDGKAPDALTIHLIPNDIFTANDETIDKRTEEMIGYYDQLIDAFHKFAPEMRIGVILTAPSSRSQDGFRNYIGAGRQSRWQYRRNIHRAWEMMIKHYAGAEKRNVYLVPSYVDFDVERHYPTWTAPASARATQSLVRVKNGTHPSPEGYQQMADAIYCWLKAINASEQASH
jgi:lysophospholipase L1-like esterase